MVLLVQKRVRYYGFKSGTIILLFRITVEKHKKTRFCVVFATCILHILANIARMDGFRPVSDNLLVASYDFVIASWLHRVCVRFY